MFLFMVVKETFFNGDPEYFKSQMASWIDQFGIETEDVKNLTVSALLGKMIPQADGESRSKLIGLLGAAERFGLNSSPASKFL